MLMKFMILEMEISTRFDDKREKLIKDLSVVQWNSLIF